VNDYVSRDLAFEFHYFFMRKLWFVYLMKAMIVFPGGFGTMDELFESLTLIQTGKVKKEVPIVLFGTAYWDKAIGIEAMADAGGPGPHESAVRAQARAVLHTFLDGLDDDLRAAFVMSELEQMTAPEVAAATGTNVNTVSSRIRAVRAQFEQMVARRRARDPWSTP
jgi:hypothetical protein